MSLLPRNLTLFRFPSSINASIEVTGNAFDDALRGVALKPCGALEMQSRGFVSPYGHGETAMTVCCGAVIGIAMGREDKILPSSVVQKALQAKLDALREREGRTPGGRERKRLRDEVLTDLLPQAFTRPSRVFAWLDLAHGWLVVDTGSRKVAESVVSLIREALGSFPALPAHSDASTRALLTGWVGGEPLPDGFLLGDTCELRDPVDAGASIRCTNQDLDSDEIRENLRAGKQCFRLGLTFDDRLGFVLTEDVVIRKLRFLDLATEALEREERDSVNAELDATFALATGEVLRLLQRLETELSLSGRDV